MEANELIERVEQIRVLVVDDEALMRAGIRLMVDGVGGITVVGEAADGAEALDAANTLDPDVILMDIRMPRMNGIEAVRALREASSRAHVIVLTAFDTDDFILDALREGALSFLLKDSTPELVLDSIRDAAKGRARISPAVLARLVSLAQKPGGVEGVAGDGRTDGASAGPAGPAGSGRPPADPTRSAAGSAGTFGGAARNSTGSAGLPASAARSSTGPTKNAASPITAPETITEREWEVGRFVAQGLTNAEIADALYLSQTTVKTHLARLFTKLHVTNRVQLAIRILELDAPPTD
ncbi:MAG: response regulator [Ancrocorticia sp.]